MAVNALPLLLLAGAAFLVMRSDEEEEEAAVKPDGNGNGNGGTALPDVTDGDEDGGGEDLPDAEEPEERILTITEAGDPRRAEFDEGGGDFVMVVGSHPTHELEALLMDAIERSAATNDVPYINLPRGSAAAMEGRSSAGSMATDERDMFLFVSAKNASKSGEIYTADWSNVIAFGGEGLEDGPFRRMLETGMTSEALSQNAGFPMFYAYYPIALPAAGDPEREEKLEAIIDMATWLFSDAAVNPLEDTAHATGDPGQMAALGSFQDAVDTALA